MPGHELAELIHGARGTGQDRLVRQIPLDVLRERRRRLVAARRLLLQGLHHDRLEVPIQPPRRPRRLRQRPRRLLADDPHRLRHHRLLHVVGKLAAEKLVEDHPQRVDVRPQVDLLGVAPHLLRAHVGERPLHHSRFRHDRRHGHVRVRDPGEAEVEDLDVGDGCRERARPGPRRGRLPHDQDVRWFEVPVDDASLVGVAHRVADLPQQGKPLAHLLRRQLPLGPAPAVVLAQGLTPDQLHGEEVQSVLRAARLVDGGDGGMLEAGEGLGLPLEHPQVRVVHVGSAADDLQGHGPARVLLLGLVDDAHPPLAELPEDPEVADHSAGCLVGTARGRAVVGDAVRVVWAGGLVCVVGALVSHRLGAVDVGRDARSLLAGEPGIHPGGRAARPPDREPDR